MWVSTFNDLGCRSKAWKDTTEGSGVRRCESGGKAAVGEIGVRKTETKGEAGSDIAADERFVIDVYTLGEVT